jgi:hypothetical protein
MMMVRIATLILLAAIPLLWVPTADARITRITITRVESPTFGSASFGEVGQFEKVVGVAQGEVNPASPLNAVIQDIDLAPRNERGMVEYHTDFYIIKPIDMTKGNGMLFYNVVNRGNKGGFTTFNLGATQPSNEPTDPGDGFLQKMGYTLIWSGWQADVLPGNNRMTLQVPVATNPDGSPITGIVRQEIVVGAPTVTTAINTSRFTSAATHTTYPTASTDNLTPFPDGFLPTLTVRTNPEDPRVPIPNADWSFASCPSDGPLVVSETQICYPAGFEPGRLYELIYRARDPLVMGLGYAGMRDLIAFFKHESMDDAGTPNPVWLPSSRPGRGHGGAEDRSALTAVFMGSSQSGRNMRTLIHLGFNQDEAGRIVFEGAFPHIGGGRAQFNHRFSHAGRAWGHVFDQDYPAYEFPFSYMPTHDPLTGATSGILTRCLKTNTCAKIFHVATALEIWEGRQSLGLTDPVGRHDLGAPGFIRTFIMVSTQHGSATPIAGSLGGPFGNCYQQSNPNPQRETMRALWKAFTDWVKDGVQPPPNAVPRLQDGTLVLPSRVNFPSIPANEYEGIARPAVRFLGLANPLRVRNWGPLFKNEDESGIITVEPPETVGTSGYTILVPQVDIDGNDLGGVRSATVLAPLGTYTGWNLGREGRWPDHLCSLQGSFIPFARTQAERLGVGDPRLSLEERYGDHAGYVAAVRAATEQLVRQRLLLPEDAARLVSEAEASDVLK